VQKGEGELPVGRLSPPAHGSDLVLAGRPIDEIQELRVVLIKRRSRMRIMARRMKAAA
jgi:hypothetical protein